MPANNQPRSRMAPEKRQAIMITAAIDVFSTTPYEQTSLAHIAQAAGTSEALIHKYFHNKAGLYTAALSSSYQQLQQRQRQDQGRYREHATRERLAVALRTYLDFLAAQPRGWALILAHPGNEPQPAFALRSTTQEHYTAEILTMIGGAHNQRDHYAVAGFFGFLAVACARWIRNDCPEDQRHVLIDAALGSLEGALGDWRS